MSDREEFEKWQAEERSKFEFGRYEFGGYVDDALEDDWLVWQAARESEGGEAVSGEARELIQIVLDRADQWERGEDLPRDHDAWIFRAKALLSATSQPDKWVPEMTDELRWILGRPNFACAPLAQTLRKMGREIDRKAEDEQAAAIHWMLELYAKHGADWRKEAEALLSAAHNPPEQESE